MLSASASSNLWPSDCKSALSVAVFSCWPMTSPNMLSVSTPPSAPGT
jgi:hypothetical protein